jgi:hypothetical protein
LSRERQSRDAAMLGDSCSIVAIELGKEVVGMPRVRICSVNGEWMNDWFTADADPDVDWRPEFTRDGQVNDTEETARRLAAMIAAIDADVVALQERPSRAAELELSCATISPARINCSQRQWRGAEAGPL